MRADEGGFTTHQSDIWMGEDALDTSTELRYHQGHPLTSLSESG